jgi:ABC-2 type transport system ATP-binding protein
MSIAISIRAVGKTYQKSPLSPAVVAVDNLSLEIPVGEVFGFIGPNGAGKSSTIRMLMGLMRPTSGEMSLFGVDVASPEARRNVGYVPESAALFDYLTPLEILQMGVGLHRVELPDQRKHCLDWLDRFGLSHVANKLVRGFSKGMQQRTALAHALAIKPRLLVLDEPLSGLDPVGRRDVVDLLADYRKSGGTIFLTSHVLHDVERLADRFGLIHQGRLVDLKSPADLLRDDRVLLVRSLGSNAIAGFSPEPGGRWVAEVESEKLWATLDLLKDAGHSVIEIKPSLSLERAFLRMVGRA